jgi:hypothetical protein
MSQMETLLIIPMLAGSFGAAFAVQKLVLHALLRAMETDRNPRS